MPTGVIKPTIGEERNQLKSIKFTLISDAITSTEALILLSPGNRFTKLLLSNFSGTKNDVMNLTLTKG